MSGSNSINFTGAAEEFYNSLFAEIPALKIMFESEQKRMMMFVSALKSIQDLSDDNARLADYLETLGKKHRSFGLTNTHMATGRRAFKKALEAGDQGLSVEEKRRFLDAFDTLFHYMGFTPDREKADG